MGSKLAPFRVVRAKIKSPQPARNAKTATVMMADRASGITIMRNVCHSEAPSTLAECISSLGKLNKKARKTRMPNGTA